MENFAGVLNAASRLWGEGLSGFGAFKAQNTPCANTSLGSPVSHPAMRR